MLLLYVFWLANKIYVSQKCLTDWLHSWSPVIKMFHAIWKKKTFFNLLLLLLYETFFEIIFVTLQIKTPGPCKIVALHAHTNVVVLTQTLSEEKLVKTNCYLLLLFFVSFSCWVMPKGSKRDSKSHCLIIITTRVNLPQIFTWIWIMKFKL